MATRSGDGWQSEVLPGLGPIAFDAYGVAHLVYSDGGGIRHAFRDGRGWHSELIAATRGAGVGIEVTRDGRLVVAYVDPLMNDARLAVLPLQPPPSAWLFLPVILR